MIAELRGVTKRYEDVLALRDVSLVLESGRVTAVLGPNGAGKTTAVKLLTGLMRPTSGAVALFGTDPRSLIARRRTGVMLQVSKVPETLTVREHIRLFCSYYENLVLFKVEEEEGALAGTTALLTAPSAPRQTLRIAPKGFRIRLNPE